MFDAGIEIGTELEETFDISQIKDEDLKNLYEITIERGIEAIQGIRSAYNKNGPENEVHFKFLTSSEFNAEAYFNTSNHHEVVFYTPNILLLRTLFDLLLSDPELLPEIPFKEKQKGPKKIKMPFVINPDKPEKVKKLSVVTNEYRLKSASMLADFCSSFILLHEIGHIVCGHTIYAKFHFGNEKIKELHHAGYYSNKEFELLQSWEYDADAFASSLIVQYIERFVETINEKPVYSKIFGELNREGLLLERLTSLVTMSVYAMFTYMAQSIKKLDKTAAHPHPLHRSFYIKDCIRNAMSDRGLDTNAIQSFNAEYFDQFSKALLKLELLPYPSLTSELVDDINASINEIALKASAKRSQYSHWSWIPSDVWH